MTTIQFLQSFASPSATAFFRLISFLGDEQFYLLLLPALYWTWRKTEVRRMSFLFLAGIFFVLVLKDLLHVARPEGMTFTEAKGYSFPSGHALGAAIVWGYLAFAVRRPWFTALAAAIVILISLSRLYLGVHWPRDVLDGVAIGLLMVFFFRRIESPLSAFVHRLGPAIDLTILFSLSVAISLLLPMEGMRIVMGLFAGMGAGMIVEERWIRFELAGGRATRALCILLGSAGTLALWKGLSLLLTTSPSATLLRYAITGFWMMGLAPLAFISLKLSSQESPSPRA